LKTLSDLIASKFYQNIKISCIKIEISAKTSSFIFRIKNFDLNKEIERQRNNPSDLKTTERD
jgi:hypothetical protein